MKFQKWSLRVTLFTALLLPLAAPLAQAQADTFVPQALGQPYLVKDVSSGTASSPTTPLLRVGSQVYFGTNDTDGLLHIWRSDGTANGTSLVSGIETEASTFGGIYPMTSDDKRVYFNVQYKVPPFSTRTAVWAVDGPEGNQQIYDDRYFYASLVSKGVTYFFDGLGAIWRVDEAPLRLSLSAPTDTIPYPHFMGGNVVVSDTLYIAQFSPDGNGGFNLWRSDGTTAGSRFVTHFGTVTHNNTNTATKETLSKPTFGPPPLPPPQFSVYGNSFFMCYGTALWYSDGTAGNTRFIRPMANGEYLACKHPQVLFSDKLYFASYGASGKTELWQSDGNIAGTNAITTLSVTQMLTATSSYFYFLASDGDSTQDSVLWKSDGTLSGTQAIKTLTSTTELPHYIVYNDKLYFQAHGQLWSSDGTEANTQPLVSGNILSNPSDFTELNGQLVFYAYSRPYGTELWISDGSAAGTHLVRDINAEGRASQLQPLYTWKNHIFFHVGPPIAPPANIWVSDGNENGTQLLHTGANVHFVGSNANVAYFIDFPTNGTQFELWRTDGTISNTTFITNTDQLSSYTPTFDIYGRTYFANGNTVWMIDPFNNDSIRLLHQFVGGVTLAVINGTLWIIESSSASRLWRSDGTPNGTVKVAEIAGTSKINVPLVAAGAQVLFLVSKPHTSQELWSSDGTLTGTMLIKTLYTGPVDYLPLYAINTAQQAYFSFVTGGQGQIWRSDGSITNTVLITSVAAANWIATDKALDGHAMFIKETRSNPDDGTSILQPYSLADDADQLVALLPEIPTLKNPSWWVSRAGNNLYFTNDNTELWQTDGTKAGTKRAFPTYSGPSTVFVSMLSAASDVQLFGTSSGGGKWALWGTDGTVIYPIVDQVTVCQYMLGPSPLVLGTTEQRMFFCGDTPATGTEPWAVPIGPRVRVTNLSPTVATSGNTVNLRASLINLPLYGNGPVTLTATLPSGVTYISDSLGISPTLNGNTLVWSMPALGLSQRDFNITLQVPNVTLGTHYPITFSNALSETITSDTTSSTDIWITTPTFVPIVLRITN